MQWITHGVKLRWKRKPPPPFDHGVSLRDATRQQQVWLDAEKERLLENGAWTRATRRSHVSRAFLVPKPGTNKWRLVVDFRWLNQWCVKNRVKMETLKKLRRLAKPGDWCFSFDLQDGFHALGIHPDFQKFMQFDLQGDLLQCSAMPFGWSDAPRVFCKFVRVMVEALRSPQAAEDRREIKRLRDGSAVRQRWSVRRRTGGAGGDANRHSGMRVLPYMDDFLVLVDSQREGFLRREKVQLVLHRLGLRRNEKKGHWEPTQVVEHLGLEVDLKLGQFRVTERRVHKIHTKAKEILCDAARNRRIKGSSRVSSCLGSGKSSNCHLPVSVTVVSVNSFTHLGHSTQANLKNTMQRATSLPTSVYSSAASQLFLEAFPHLQIARPEQGATDEVITINRAKSAHVGSSIATHYLESPPQGTYREVVEVTPASSRLELFDILNVADIGVLILGKFLTAEHRAALACTCALGKEVTATQFFRENLLFADCLKLTDDVFDNLVLRATLEAKEGVALTMLDISGCKLLSWRAVRGALPHMGRLERLCMRGGPLVKVTSGAETRELLAELGACTAAASLSLAIRNDEGSDDNAGGGDRDASHLSAILSSLSMPDPKLKIEALDLALSHVTYADEHAFEYCEEEDRIFLRSLLATNERRRSERLAALAAEGAQDLASNNPGGPHDEALEPEDVEMLHGNKAATNSDLDSVVDLTKSKVQHIGDIVFRSLRHDYFEGHRRLGNTAKNTSTVTSKLHLDVRLLR
ncbi:hypothetical protein CYMTET_12476 [Cymbomonas tetramitiformis]|uniref:Reverse transcriptase domain-containing protein n=2 Tax=Cymbomonas tetramitiformis TaxID=36881 RepID=A0AAE0GKC5_9CHLO|nr:hypothetical protein CYMTET_12476 [Cymbomonas tetramitiformis]